MQHPLPSGAIPDRRISHEEFLAFIADKEEEYEYVNGRAVALASPSKKHGRLVTVLITLLQNHMRGSDCDVYGSQDLETVPGKQPRRPDLAVTCDERDKHDEDSDYPVHFPKLVVEVLSPNRGDDLSDKFTEYQALRSIEEYVLVDSSRHWVRRYHRNGDGQFVVDADQISGSLSIESIGYTLDIDALYNEARV